MSATGQLLAEYAESRSEDAFRELVGCYLGLVYGTALRLLDGDEHLAQDASQRVFADLARMAGSFNKEVHLGGWLHRHTCFTASKILRTERRRLAREREAQLMNDDSESSNATLAAISPVLDDAINDLNSKDRQAILLRYFEQQDLRSVGQSLGSSEDGARKRVNRALEKLRGLLKKRGISLSAAALGSALSAQAISAAPAGLAAGLATAALGTAAAGGGTAYLLLQIMSMTKFQTCVIAALAIGLGAPLVLQSRTASRLRSENETLRAEVQQAEALAAENSRLTKLLAQAQKPAPAQPGEMNELMRLRGEVGMLKRTANEANAVVARGKEAPLNDVTANPEMHKMLRDQQKLGLSMIYKGFANHANLPEEKIEALNNLLADSVMTNIAHITAILRDGKSPQEMEQILARQEKETNEQVKQLVGEEAFGKFQEYNRHLASYLTAEQFKSMLPGEKEAKDAVGKQLYDLMRQETRNALAARGLTEDYQTVPTLNFRNFASEQIGENNLELLDSIYARVQEGASGFMSPEQVEKFGEFRKMAINNNRVALAVNRKLMAPAAAQ